MRKRNKAKQVMKKIVVKGNITKYIEYKLKNNGLVVKVVDSKSRGSVFKSTGWLHGRPSLSSFRGR